MPDAEQISSRPLPGQLLLPFPEEDGDEDEPEAEDQEEDQ